MIDSILYLIFCLFFPRRADFIRMGLGIKARRYKNKEQWDNHHALVAQFCRQAFKKIDSKQNRSLLILGCGRLYDLPVEFLKGFKSVVLVDADPLALFIARIKTRRLLGITCRLGDVTGMIDAFSRAKDTLPEVVPALAEYGNYDVIISLNLLGQIPLYFLDRAEKHNFGFSEKELLAFSDALQVAHIRAVMDKSLHTAIFIYDRAFFFSEPDSSGMQEVPAVKEDLFDAYVHEAFDKWYWSVDAGAMHLIEAREYLMPSRLRL